MVYPPEGPRPPTLEELQEVRCGAFPFRVHATTVLPLEPLLDIGWCSWRVAGLAVAAGGAAPTGGAQGPCLLGRSLCWRWVLALGAGAGCLLAMLRLPCCIGLLLWAMGVLRPRAVLTSSHTS